MFVSLGWTLKFYTWQIDLLWADRFWKIWLHYFVLVGSFCGCNLVCIFIAILFIPPNIFPGDFNFFHGRVSSTRIFTVTISMQNVFVLDVNNLFCCRIYFFSQIFFEILLGFFAAAFLLLKPFLTLVRIYVSFTSSFSGFILFPQISSFNISFTSHSFNLFVYFYFPVQNSSQTCNSLLFQKHKTGFNCLNSCINNFV